MRFWQCYQNISLTQKRANCAISCAGYNAHTEPLLKIYKLLKIEDIYNCPLLVLYYNLLHNKVPQYLSSFLPNTSLATNRYPITHPRLQPPSHSHAFISQTIETCQQASTYFWFCIMCKPRLKYSLGSLD